MIFLIFFLEFIVRMQHMNHITYKVSVNQLFILLERLPVNSRLSITKFGESKVIWLYADAILCRGGVGDSHIVQRSTVSFFFFTIPWILLWSSLFISPLICLPRCLPVLSYFVLLNLFNGLLNYLVTASIMLSVFHTECVPSIKS